MEDQLRKSELRHQARIRLGAQRERVRMLRRRAIAASVLAFVLLWAVVFTQMVSGNDPVLSAKTTKPKLKTVASAPPQRDHETSEANETSATSETSEIEAMEAEATELEAAEIEAAELEVAEVEALEAEAAEIEPEAVTTSPS